MGLISNELGDKFSGYHIFNPSKSSTRECKQPYVLMPTSAKKRCLQIYQKYALGLIKSTYVLQFLSQSEELS